MFQNASIYIDVRNLGIKVLTNYVLSYILYDLP